MMLDEINRRTNPFPSTVYAATQTSADLKNKGGRGLLATIDVTIVPGTDTVQLKIYAKVGSKYILMAQSAALVATGTVTLLIYPGAGVAANGVTVVSGFPMPETYQVIVTHSALSNFTYSVSVEHLL